MKYTVILLLIFILFGCENSNKYFLIPDDTKISKNESDSTAVIKYEDSIRVIEIKPGFYYRKTPVSSDDQEYLFYNEINWIYVSETYKTTFFLTVNNESCYTKGLNSSKSPKEIYRQLNKNPDKINSIPIGRCRKPTLPPNKIMDESIIIIDTIINSDQFENRLKMQEKLIFQKDGIIRSTLNYKNEQILLKYKYVGK